MRFKFSDPASIQEYITSLEHAQKLYVEFIDFVVENKCSPLIVQPEYERFSKRIGPVEAQLNDIRNAHVADSL
jgi:hypothetical protein